MIWSSCYLCRVGAVCCSDCCRNLSAPYQPCDKSSVESTREQVNKKGETRAFNPKWYDEFKWIHLCTARKRVFCFYCVQCHQKGVLNFTRKYDSAFILDGFHNWKKGRERLQRHERSECHKEAVLKLNSMKGPGTTKLRS